MHDCNCAVCGKSTTNLKALSRHVSYAHNIDKKLYYDTHLRAEGEGLCKGCGKETTFKSFSYGYNVYCSSKCAANDPDLLEQKKRTNIAKYGCENPMQSREIREIQEKTCLEKYGASNVFASEEIKYKIEKKNIEKYGVKNVSSLEDIKNKKIETCRNNFGVDYPMQSLEVQKRSKSTCRDRYGCDNISQYKEIKDKKSKTTMMNYGKDNPFKSDKVKEKIERTNLDRYGCKNPSQSPTIKDKKRATTLKHYGVEVPYKSEEIRARGFKTLIENGGYNNSKPEEELYLMLCDKYGKENVIRQYKETRYPFFCDFYIKSEDIFIELNGFWTHQDHWFDENSEEDVKLLRELQVKSRKSNFYSAAIEVWTKSDILKRDTASKNGLNYVVFWDTDLSDAEEWLRHQ